MVYVDNDPLVVSHMRWLEGPSTRVVQADLRQPEALLADPELRALIDLDQPVAVLMVAVLHQVQDDTVAAHTVRTLRDAVALGSYLAIAHPVSDLQPETTAKLTALYQERVGADEPRRANLRTRADVEPYFDGLELLAPGLVYLPDWRPDPDSVPPPPTEPVWAVGGVGLRSERVVSASREIAAGAAEIFELIADPAQQPRWDGNDNLSEAPAGQRVRAVGDVFLMTLTRRGVRENHVVEFVEGRRIAWRPSEPGRPEPGHLWRWTLEPIDEDRTRVTHTYDWSQLTDEQRLPTARATTAERLFASLDRLAALAEQR